MENLKFNEKKNVSLHFILYDTFIKNSLKLIDRILFKLYSI